ncbi:cation diffusion facilitator family transporter [Myxococcus sp. Y35]|uniref:cation diffusion facilitator family transporter n=1 Tax=Pseudomyxococcus flavus TaxID=3115648 RepID=UPI003CF97123
MGAGHHHGGHSHAHGQPRLGRAFAWGIGLNLAFVAVEATYGVLANSLALLADAGHNLSDVLGLALACGASVLARRGPTSRHTYGLKSASILAALFNALLLLVAVGGIGWEAIQRFGEPAPVGSTTVMTVAGVGILLNTGTALLFWKDRKSDLNVRGAFLHMAADAGVSLGVVLAGALIGWTGWAWLDPVVTLVIAALILVSTWGLLRESLALVLDAVPAGVDLLAVRELLERETRARDVHDLHVWGMSTTEAALTAHLVLPHGTVDDQRLAHLRNQLHNAFGIEHVTLQVETGELSGRCAVSSNCTPDASAAPTHAHA